MKVITKYFIFFLFTLLTSCSKNNNLLIPNDIEVQNFVWKGLNAVYFWKDKIPDLNETKFKNQSQLNSFLKGFSTPESAFESLLYDRSNTDKWSLLFDNYIALENWLKGASLSSGMEFGLVHVSNNNTDIFGYVRYVLPNSDASLNGIKRGMIFNSVNGTALTINNFKSLLFSGDASYTLGFANYNNDGTVTKNERSIALTKSNLQENPIFLTSVITKNSHKIGYLMYNGFYSSFDSKLNNAIRDLKNLGITDLILDLRYNGGGSVTTAGFLASMITGQFTGQLFTRERWNNQLQKNFENNNPENLINNFSDKLSDKTPINHLNLDNLYVITTGSTASASELVINGLKPYITVKTIGTKTVGKYVASITVYDSPDLVDKIGINQNHTYAMQPIVLEELNKLDKNDKDGFDPNVKLKEDYGNLGVLGNENEPLLNAAINLVTNGLTVISARSVTNIKKPITGSNEIHSNQNMVVDKKINLNLNYQ